MRIDFVNDVALKLGIKRRDLVEKDIILHQLLLDLSEDDFFSGNFVFKGGTCLIKCYYGYIRFSEDIDFTWKNQRVYNGKSQNEIRRYLSGIIDRVGKIFEEIAKKRGLDFKIDKSNRDYVELGSSDKFCTFKIWYESEVLGRKSFIKVQINFVEDLCFKVKAGKARSLLTKQYPELKALYPEYTEYARPINFSIYDVREILSEKIRAILTRRGIKARDFLDVYLIGSAYRIRPEDVEKCTIRKIRFALKNYERFKTHFDEKVKLLDSGDIFEWGTERELLISDIDEKEFYSFLRGFQGFLKKIVKEVSLKS